MRRSALIPHTRPAMEATEYAKTQDLFDPYHRALFKAYWEEGKNLGDNAVLLEEADRVGLEREGLAAVLHEGRYTQEVEQQVRFAHAVGITGIPAFILNGKYLLMGAQPYPVFKQAMEKVLEERGDGGRT